jgi:hypothetical protein
LLLLLFFSFLFVLISIDYHLTCQVLDAKLFKPDEAVAQCIYDHECTVRLLSKAILFPIGQG